MQKRQLTYHDALTLPFLALRHDWPDSGQGLAWHWQPPAAFCQSAAREDQVKVRHKHQRNHVNTTNEKNIAICAKAEREELELCSETDHTTVFNMLLYKFLLLSICSTISRDGWKGNRALFKMWVSISHSRRIFNAYLYANSAVQQLLSSKLCGYTLPQWDGSIHVD